MTFRMVHILTVLLLGACISIAPMTCQWIGIEACIVGFGGIGALLLVWIVFRSSVLTLLLIFTAATTQAVFALIGLPRMVPTLFAEVCILLLLLKMLYVKLVLKPMPLKFIGFFPVTGLFIVMIFSFFLNSAEPLPAVFCIRQTFIFILFFVAIQNIDLSKKQTTRVNQYIVFLILIQLPAALVKLIVIGQDESWVGTISHQAGSLSTTFPLFVISFLLALFFFKRRLKYVALIGGFFLFGIIGEKRALAFYLPVLIAFSLYLYGKRHNYRLTVISGRQLVYAMVFGVIGLACFVGAVKMIPSLNPEGTYGGSFDVNYIIKNRIIGYNFRDDVAESGFNAQSTMGRVTITKIALTRLREAGVLNSLFGFGPGTMIRSSHLGRSKKTPYDLFGIYGHYTGFVVYVLQAGLLGVLCLSYLFIKLFMRAYKTYRLTSDIDMKIFSLGFMGAVLIFFIDFFTYSQTTFNQQALIPLFFYAATLIIKQQPVVWTFQDNQRLSEVL